MSFYGESDTYEVSGSTFDCKDSGFLDSLFVFQRFFFHNTLFFFKKE